MYRINELLMRGKPKGRYNTINNFGGGDCGFYSFAIGLMLEIQRQADPKILNTLKTAYDNYHSSISKDLKGDGVPKDWDTFQKLIKDFNPTQQNENFLMFFNLLLRKILVEQYQNKIQEKIKHTAAVSLPWFDDVFMVFKLFLAGDEKNQKIKNKLQIEKNEFYLNEKYRNLIETLAKQWWKDHPRLKLSNKTLENYLLQNEKELQIYLLQNGSKPITEDSPDSLFQTVFKNLSTATTWATQMDLTTLSDYFGTELYTYDKGQNSYAPNKIYKDRNIYRKLSGDPIVRVNNVKVNNIDHWVTLVEPFHNVVLRSDALNEQLKTLLTNIEEIDNKFDSINKNIKEKITPDLIDKINKSLEETGNTQYKLPQDADVTQSIENIKANLTKLKKQIKDTQKSSSNIEIEKNLSLIHEELNNFDKSYKFLSNLKDALVEENDSCLKHLENVNAKLKLENTELQQVLPNVLFKTIDETNKIIEANETHIKFKKENPFHGCSEIVDSIRTMSNLKGKLSIKVADSAFNSQLAKYKSYIKFAVTPELTIEEIKAVFADYTKSNKASRIFQGHWKHHHVSRAKIIISECNKQPPSIKDILETIIAQRGGAESPNFNKDGEFAKRVDYICLRQFGMTYEQYMEYIKAQKQEINITMLPPEISTNIFSYLSPFEKTMMFTTSWQFYLFGKDFKKDPSKNSSFSTLNIKPFQIKDNGALSELYFYRDEKKVDFIERFLQSLYSKEDRAKQKMEFCHGGYPKFTLDITKIANNITMFNIKNLLEIFGAEKNYYSYGFQIPYSNLDKKENIPSSLSNQEVTFKLCFENKAVVHIVRAFLVNTLKLKDDNYNLIEHQRILSQKNRNKFHLSFPANFIFEKQGELLEKFKLCLSTILKEEDYENITEVIDGIKNTFDADKKNTLGYKIQHAFRS